VNPQRLSSCEHLRDSSVAEGKQRYLFDYMGEQMLSWSDLRELCVQSYSGLTYYRPFLCKRYQSEENQNLWIVGGNPVTPITVSDMGLDEYVNLLRDYDGFME
jgi:hypothetical protein